MSKRLTEEAMNYFDECVSISTFDSSDFSSPEDQPVVNIPADPILRSDSSFSSSTNSGASANCSVARNVGLNKESDDQVQSTLDHQTSGLVSGSSTTSPIRHRDKVYSDTTPTRNLHFSFACAQTKAVGVHSDCMDVTSSTYYDADEESLVLEKDCCLIRLSLRAEFNLVVFFSVQVGLHFKISYL
ncbi:hypothetical protein MKX01_032775 [Papaver californicum]|nr:hypothetical protein MKX01_032775 [Papaver californicum]